MDGRHNRQLPDDMSHLTGCNFITRKLIYQSYWLCRFFISCSFTSCNCFIKEIYDMIWYLIQQRLPITINNSTNEHMELSKKPKTTSAKLINYLINN